MSQISTIVPTMVTQWKTGEIGLTLVFKYLGNVARSGALAWIVYQSGNLEALGYLCVGVALLAMLDGALASGGWALDNELYGKTLDFAMISRTSLPTVLLSKTLGQIIYEIPSCVVACLAVLLVARTVPQVDNWVLLVLGVIFAVVGLIILSFFFANLVVLVGGRAGFFMGIIPFGAVLSGFILPVQQLPVGLEALARLVPSSWAMDAVWLAVKGSDSWSPVIFALTMSVLASSIWFAVSYYMCKIVEKRIRIEGTLGNF